jgi:acetyltransferase
LQPASIAVIGSDSELGAQILANLSVGGFKGKIHSLRNASQLGLGIDLAVLAVPPDQIGDAMTLMARQGCFAAILPGAADDLRAHAIRTGVRALGGHSFGLAVPRLGLNATRSHIAPPLGRLALVSQSASVIRSVIDWAEPNGVGFSHIVGVGDHLDIGHGMVLDALSRDADTSAILLDIRSIRDGRLFLSAARAAARLRPVVAICAGLRQVSPDGTANLSFEAAVRRAGVLYVNRLEDMLAAAETLARARPVRSDTLAIVSAAVGPGRMAADCALRAGIELYQDETLTPDVVPTELASTAFAMAARSDVGGVLVLHAPLGPQDEATINTLIGKHPEQRAPVLVCAMGETTGALHRATLARAGLAVFATPEQAVHGFEHLVQDRRNRAAARELPARTVLTVAPDVVRVRSIFGQARAAGRLGLTQDESLDVLAAYGVPAVPTRCVASPEDAAPAAELLGYPATVKLREACAPADRATAGLALDLSSAAAVAAAARRLAEDSAELLVQCQVSRGRELAVRVADDAMFGPAILFGPGGTDPHPLDHGAGLPPLNLALARALIGRSRIGAVLGRPRRDRPVADIDAVAEALVRISQLIVDFPEIAVLDVPTLFAVAGGVMAVDAWVRLRGADEPPARLAITPYPAEMVTHVEVGGDAVTIRPIRPEDAEAHIAFLSRLSPQDLRYRFFNTVRELSREQVARLTQVDYDREIAFIATRDVQGDTIGVARLIGELDGRSGEFAVVVQPDMKGRGLGSVLMRRVIEWGRQKGWTEVVGPILSENSTMLDFIRRLGFTCRRMADDPGVMEARLQL